MDDIDKLRDDLQSTKQMLAQELRNKEAQDRENKRLLAKIQNLEAEMTKSKSDDGAGEAKKKSSGGDNEALVKSLKSEAEEAQNTSKLLEKKYQDAAGQLDSIKSELEEQKRKFAELEKKLAQSQVMKCFLLFYRLFLCFFFCFLLYYCTSMLKFYFLHINKKENNTWCSYCGCFKLNNNYDKVSMPAEILVNRLLTNFAWNSIISYNFQTIS